MQWLNLSDVARKKRNKQITTSMILASLLCPSLFIGQSVLAISMPVSTKHAQMLLPSYEKLFQGAGPNTNDNGEANEKQLDSSESADLSPMSLSDGRQNKDSTADGAVLKSTVTTTDYLPSESNPIVLGAQSVKGTSNNSKNNKADKGSLSDQAAAVKVGPLPLLETDGEAQKKADTMMDAEKIQLADLWEATLTRSPDIQFIVQKLQPTSNQAHLTNVLAKMLSTAAFGGLGAMSMMSPSIGTYAAASMGSSMMQTALGMSQSHADKKAKLSQEEQMMMYNMVRQTCDKLVASYREYKKCSNSLNRAADDLQDLQNMVNDAKTGQDAAKQLEMDYTLRKQKRDMDTIAEDLQHHKQNLVDLSGPEAVAKLDQQLIEEHERLKQIAGENMGTKSNEDSIDQFDAEKNKTQTATSICPQS